MGMFTFNWLTPAVEVFAALAALGTGTMVIFWGTSWLIRKVRSFVPPWDRNHD